MAPISQPYHAPLAVTVNSCPSDPLSYASQNHLSGNVTNNRTAASGGPVTADPVRVIFTFFDCSGTMG